MELSPDFRRIDGGAVLVDSQEPWGYPHLFPAGRGQALTLAGMGEELVMVRMEAEGGRGR